MSKIKEIMQKGKKRGGQNSYTPSKIMKIVEQICENYATGEYTLESCCKNAGVPVRTFSGWFFKYQSFGDNVPEKWQYFAELADLYTITKKIMLRGEKEILIESSRKSLLKLIEGYTKEQSIAVYENKLDINGNEIPVLVRIKIVKKEIGPNVRAIIFLLTKLCPEVYGDKVTVVHKFANENYYDKMSDEELMAEIARLESI